MRGILSVASVLMPLSLKNLLSGLSKS